jgi:hypothetical protein
MNNEKFDHEQFTQDVLEFIGKNGDTVDQNYVQELLYLFHKYFHDNGGITAFSLYLKNGEIYNAITNYKQVPGRDRENWNVEIKNSLAEIASRPENKGTIFLTPIIYAENEKFIPPANIKLNRTFILNEETITARLSITSKEEARRYSKENMIMDPDSNNIDMSLIRKNNPIDVNGNRPFISSALVTSIWKGDEFIGLLMAGYKILNCFSGAGYLTPTETLKVKALTELIAAGLNLPI